MFSLCRARLTWPASAAPRLQSRHYAVSVEPAKVHAGKRTPRVYVERKSFLYSKYFKLLETSAESPLIFLTHADFSAQRLLKLRRDIITASNRMTPSLTAPSPSVHLPQPTLTVLRTSVFGAALRDYTSVDASASAQLADSVKGHLAVLTLPKLNPPQLQAVLRALDRGVPPRKPKTEEELAKEKEEKNADPAQPGRRVKRMRAVLQPELRLAGALIERQLFTPDGIRDVSKLPTLDTLRSQIVGLLSSPATQLAGVLSQASGGRLTRTLEGFKKSLEEGNEASA